MAEDVTITATKNGPYYVQGRITVQLANGDVVTTEEETWLCRCGASETKPFCDGSHSRVGFRAVDSMPAD